MLVLDPSPCGTAHSCRGECVYECVGQVSLFWGLVLEAVWVDCIHAGGWTVSQTGKRNFQVQMLRDKENDK